MNNKQLGALGEKHAAQFLRNKNYKILETNFSCCFGEIDIIAKDKNSIVFVEVKTRRSTNYGKGMEAVNFHKQQKLKKAALYYINENDPVFSNIRFDVIDILIKDDQHIEIIHIENAF